MFNVREDFPMLEHDYIYFDNGATTFKPNKVIDAINDYYRNYTANAHRGDYDLSYKVDLEFENARNEVKRFINATHSESIIFTSGATEGLNMVVSGFFKHFLEANDEIILNQSEHASNVIPWFNLVNSNKCVIKYAPLDKDYKLTFESIRETITSNTKVISLAHITNVIGDVRDIKRIIEYAHTLGIFVVVDASQSIAHMKIDVSDLNPDFLVFSGHKMYGPTGIGILYGNLKLLEQLEPINYGGGMNESFDDEFHINLKSLPYRLEAGTPNIEGAIGLGAAIKYLNQIGMDNIIKYESNLKDYLIDKLDKISHVDIINYNSESAIVSFNVVDIFSQDIAYYLNKYNICVRAGNHCAKILKHATHTTNSIRISLSFYNTHEEIDALIELLSNKSKIEKEMI